MADHSRSRRGAIRSVKASKPRSCSAATDCLIDSQTCTGLDAESIWRRAFRPSSAAADELGAHGRARRARHGHHRVRAMASRIVVRSQRRRASCSCSSRPDANVGSPALRAAAQSREHRRARLMTVTSSPRIHVLVADDEPHIGRIIKMKLEQGPFRVTLAYDGREALEIWSANPTSRSCCSMS